MKEFFQDFISNAQVVGWAVAFVIFLIAEGLTFNALVSVWFAVAAIFAMFAAMAGLGFIWQFVIFAISSVVLFFLTRPLIRKLKGNPPDPNTDYDIGKTAVVIEDVVNKEGKGRVKLDGVDWAARSADGGDITEGSIVTVKSVDGSKLIVGR